MRIAYLVSEYPKVSHSFIRREIAALEALGVEIDRYALRESMDGSPDPADHRERTKTRYVLGAGGATILGSLVAELVSRPLRFLRALAMALRLSRSAERGLFHHAAYLIEACVLARWMARSNTTHLHAHFGSNPATVALLVSQLRDTTFSFTAHGTVETDAARFIGIPEKVARAAFVFAVSGFGKSQLCRWVHPDHWRKIVVVPCGLDDTFRRAPERLSNANRRFVCVGRLSPEKGQFVLIEALAELHRNSIEVELVLVGDGELRADIEAYAAQLGVAHLMQITGWLSGESVREQISDARALVLSSFAEGLPVVIMEAMASARPVLATRVGGVPELVRDGVDGWLVGPGCATELANAMRECLAASADTLERMGAAARTRALERHDVARSAEIAKGMFGTLPN